MNFPSTENEIKFSTDDYQFDQEMFQINNLNHSDPFSRRFNRLSFDLVDNQSSNFQFPSNGVMLKRK